MLTSNRDRFKDAPWIPKLEESVMVGGAGGIGSWVAFFLARIGFNVHIYDNDVIEEHNLGGQLFNSSDIGSAKVDAVARIAQEFSGSQISTWTTAINATSPGHVFMISAFDNMAARKYFFEAWKRAIAVSTMTPPIFIDGRLEMEQLQIFCVTPATADRYEQEYLFDDSVVEELSCTAKQTSHSAAMIASHMVGFFTNHIANIYEGMVYRETPFYYEYVTPMSLTEEIR